MCAWACAWKGLYGYYDVIFDIGDVIVVIVIYVSGGVLVTFASRGQTPALRAPPFKRGLKTGPKTRLLAAFFKAPFSKGVAAGVFFPADGGLPSGA